MRFTRIRIECARSNRPTSSDPASPSETSRRRLAERALNPLHCRRNEIVNRYGFDRELQAAGGQARKVEQVADEAIEAVGLLFDDLGALVAVRLHAVRERLDRGERRAQVVRDRGDEDVLEAIGFLERRDVLHLGFHTAPLHAKRGVERHRVQHSLLRRIQLEPARLREFQCADRRATDAQRQRAAG